MLVVFDPDGLTGAPYAKRVTAHTAAATTATIEAAAVIGTARAIDRDVPWVHALVAEDATATGIIALTNYAPGSGAAYSTTSTSMADVDATNMKVDFVVPPSGKVRIRVEAYQDLTSAIATPTTDSYYWTLHDGTSPLTELRISRLPALTLGSVSWQGRANVSWVVSGLTPGGSKSYKLQHRVADVKLEGRILRADAASIFEVMAVNI
jgi:hypothetical protein